MLAFLHRGYQKIGKQRALKLLVRGWFPPSCLLPMVHQVSGRTGSLAEEDASHVLLSQEGSATAAAAAAAKSLQSCPTLCDPIDGSPRGSPVPGILQARTLEWVAISFSNA